MTNDEAIEAFRLGIYEPVVTKLRMQIRGLEMQLATAREEGAREMREKCLQGINMRMDRIHLTELVAYIKALPIPGTAEKEG